MALTKLDYLHFGQRRLSGERQSSGSGCEAKSGELEVRRMEGALRHAHEIDRSSTQREQGAAVIIGVQRVHHVGGRRVLLRAADQIDDARPIEAEAGDRAETRRP